MILYAQSDRDIVNVFFCVETNKLFLFLSLFSLGDSYWLLLWWAYTIGPMSADQYKQIGIRRGARSFQLRGVFMKQN
jgi:hypothetical protein